MVRPHRKRDALAAFTPISRISIVGLWDWVWDRLLGSHGSPARSGGPTAPKSRAAGGKSAAPRPAGAATAIADPPTEEAAVTFDPAHKDDAWWSPPGATLTELAPITRANISAEILALENLIVTHFDGRDLTLPPMPRVPELVLRELSSPEYNVRRIGAEISEDQVTAAAVLRLANSPLYRGASQITAVEPALVRVGTTAIRTLMLHQTMMSLTRAERKQSQRLADILALRAVASGAAMQHLAEFTQVDPDEAFMFGLLHDIGAVLVLRIINRQRFYVGRVDLDAFEYLSYQAHQEFGELLADAWHLPDRVSALMSNHHQYPLEDDPLRTERLMLHVADMMGGLLGFAPEAPYDLLRSRAAVDLGLADNPRFLKALPELPDRINDALQAFA